MIYRQELKFRQTGISIFAYQISNLSSVQRNMDDGDVKQSNHLTGNSSNTLSAPSKLETSLLKDPLTNRTTGDRASVKAQMPSGNRVAVRKYREKKKAKNEYLEEEVKKLRVVNRVLIRKLQLQAALEAEAVRLRSLLVKLKTQIDNEMVVSRFYKQSSNGVSDHRS